MAIRNQELTVNFLVWDTNANKGKVGDTGNITLKIARDGVAQTVGPNRVSEMDSADMPGIYKITLNAQEMDGDFICVSGKSSSLDVVVYPAFIQTERGDLSSITGLLNQIIGAISVIPNNIATKADVDAVSTTVTQLAGTVNTMVNNGVKLNNDGKTDAQNAAAAAIANGVKLNNDGKADVQTAAVAGIEGITLQELNNVPNAAPSLLQAITLQYMVLRNKTVNTQTSTVIYKKGGQQILSSALLDDDKGVFTRGELS